MRLGGGDRLSTRVSASGTRRVGPCRGLYLRGGGDSTSSTSAVAVGAADGNQLDRGLASSTSARPQHRPARFAAQALIDALRAAGGRVSGGAGARTTPIGFREIAATPSPPMSRLIT